MSSGPFTMSCFAIGSFEIAEPGVFASGTTPTYSE